MFMLCSYSGSDGNSPKRGYPDVSLLGVHYAVVIGDQTYALDGTSASTPVFAGGIIVSAFSLLSFFFCNKNMKNIVLKGMVSLVNAARVAAGKGGLGWLNPTLYKYSNQFAYDVTCGNNKCGLLGSPCCATGFTATTGWDPVSGLGSVNFTSFKALLAGLGNHLNIPSAAPVIPPAPPITHKPSVTAAPTVSNTGWAYQYTYAGRSCSDSVISVTANPVGVCLQHYILSAKTSYIPLGYKMYSCNNGN